MTQVAIVNQSTVVSDADGSTITAALNEILPQFCKEWSLSTYTCVYVGKGRTSTIPIKIFLLDTSDVKSALAYHDQDDDFTYGKAFAKTVLSNGGVMLYSSNPKVFTFAQAVSHELFEIIMDPYCNVWAVSPNGRIQYAYEVCDPVQSNVVTVQVKSSSKSKSLWLNKKSSVVYTKVGLSDWVLPRWFNPEAIKGPFNHNNTLNAPFTLDKDGYAICLNNKTIYTIFGQSVSESKKAMIKAHVRLTKRL